MKRFALVLAIALTGCERQQSSPEALQAQRTQCTRHGLIAVPALNWRDGSVLLYRCMPERCS